MCVFVLYYMTIICVLIVVLVTMLVATITTRYDLTILLFNMLKVEHFQVLLCEAGKVLNSYEYMTMFCSVF